MNKREKLIQDMRDLGRISLPTNYSIESDGIKISIHTNHIKKFEYSSKALGMVLVDKTTYQVRFEYDKNGRKYDIHYQDHNIENVRGFLVREIKRIDFNERQENYTDNKLEGGV